MSTSWQLSLNLLCQQKDTKGCQLDILDVCLFNVEVVASERKRKLIFHLAEFLIHSHFFVVVSCCARNFPLTCWDWWTFLRCFLSLSTSNCLTMSHTQTDFWLTEWAIWNQCAITCVLNSFFLSFRFPCFSISRRCVSLDWTLQLCLLPSFQSKPAYLLPLSLPSSRFKIPNRLLLILLLKNLFGKEKRENFSPTSFSASQSVSQSILSWIHV